MVLLSILTFLFPLVSAVTILFVFKKIGINIHKISIFFSYLTVFSSTVLLFLFFSSHIDNFLFFDSSIFALYITPLCVVMTFFVSLVSLIIHMYSVKYMFDEEGYARYFILLDLMIFVIFGLATAGNIIALAAFWHMMGVILYFLLVHNFRKKQTYKFGFYTLFTHLLADIPLLIAVYLIYNFYKTTNLKLFLDTANLHQLYFSDTHIAVAPVIAIFIMISAIIKSAGFPFHIWLPFTLEGPNPVSALMHAGIVNAGAFIANRFAPLFIHGDIALHVALIIGFITAILGSALMLMQNDIKKALAYSTVGQMGYMMLEIGSGAFSLAIYHMMVHGIFKASLFLGSGGIIHEARHENNISEKSIFDFLFSNSKTKKPTFLEYMIFVVIIPLVVAFFIFSPLVNKTSYDSVMVFYLFAWVSGSQAIYTVYHSGKRYKALVFTTFGFGFALFLYVVMEHLWGSILYPNHQLFKNLYQAASWKDANFFTIYGITFSIVLSVWLTFYQKFIKHKSIFTKFNNAQDFIYRIFSREFYILDFCSLISIKLIGFSKIINHKIKY